MPTHFLKTIVCISLTYQVTILCFLEGVKVSGVQVVPHPLVMLGESPTHLLGRLIFERKFPPEMYGSLNLVLQCCIWLVQVGQFCLQPSYESCGSHSERMLPSN